MARKTKRDWFVTAVQILRQAGPQGLTIEALCQSLQMTKGSFYHHFGSYEGFKTQFLAFYEQEGTLDIISQLADLPTPKEKLQQLLKIVVEFSTKLPDNPDVAMRIWALQDTAVAQTQSRVDGRRRQYVQSLCEEITGDSTQAATIANLIYAVLVGSEQMQPPIVGAALQHLFDECLRLYNLT
ncbi:TetR/AcrR family transcriptional regulator [Candidatus Leptofilum sp.]|uniref:TetR/AcrR family transcriptional regulator n=1 Tax=Candidatus Leptofilum sp. TaxID=3241576 RepID=UPI003B59859A